MKKITINININTKNIILSIIEKYQLAIPGQWATILCLFVKKRLSVRGFKKLF